MIGWHGLYAGPNGRSAAGGGRLFRGVNVPIINCVCGHRMEGADDHDLFRAVRVHSDQAHPDLHISDEWIDDLLAVRARMTPWDGQRLRIAGPPRTEPLGPTSLDDFLRFFDHDAFMDNPDPDWASCYCFHHHFTGTPAEWVGRTAAQNRAAMSELVRDGQAHGWLAYVEGRPAGWCHAAPRLSLPALAADEELTTDDADTVGSIVCFVVAAPYRRQGIARQLLAAACDGFRQRGLALAEAYPAPAATSDARAHHGPLGLYLCNGFTVHRETARRVIVRRPLITSVSRR
jgi:GNAT superfamily N-acetyltransferase